MADPFDPGLRMVSDYVGQRGQATADLAKSVVFSPFTALDTAASSLIQFGSLGTIDIDSIYGGEKGEGGIRGAYHDTRYQSQVIADVGSLFLIGGTLMKAGRMEGLMGQAARAGVDRAAQSGASLLGRELRATAASEALFSNMRRTEVVDGLLASAQTRMSANVADLYGVMVPRLDEGQRAGVALTQAARMAEGSSIGAVRSANQKDFLVQAIKESIAQEVMIFALYNNSDFLFPDGASSLNYLGWGAFGVGVNTGVMQLQRAASLRRLVRDGQLGAAAIAGERRNRFLTEGQGPQDVVGERWPGGLAAIYGLERTEALETAVNSIVADSRGLLSSDQVRAQLSSLRSDMSAQLERTLQKLLTDRPAVDILTGKSGIAQAISKRAGLRMENVVSEMSGRVKENPTAMLGLVELADTGAASRAMQVRELLDARIDDALRAVSDAPDAKAAKAAQSKLDDLQAERVKLDGFRVGTVERGGAINYAPDRLSPHWEQHRGARATFVRGQGWKLSAGNEDALRVRLNADGSVDLRAVGKKGGVSMVRAVDADLNFEQITALQTMVGQLVKDANNTRGFAKSFWAAFSADATKTLEDLPFPVLDAITAGRIPLPEDAVEAARIQMMVSTGETDRVSLLKKLEWAKKHGKTIDEGELFESQLGLFDLEKALNLKLTDNVGRPNGLGHSVTAYQMQDSVSAREILLAGSPNDGLRRLRDLGLGWADPGTALEREALGETFFEGLRGMDNIGDVDRPGGVGAIYHAFSEATDTEQQLVQLVANREAVRQATLLESDHPMFASIADEFRQNEIAFEGSRQVSQLVDLRQARNNVITQSTFKHRFQNVIQHAKHMGDRSQFATDAYKIAMIKPVAEKARALLKTPEGQATIMQLSNAKRLVERGIGLSGEVYAAGRNELDLSRPGARKLLDNTFGELKGAPKGDEPWELFDVTLAWREGRYVPVELTDEAAELLNDFTRISYDQLDGINSVRRANGRPVINKLHGHMPIDDFRRYKMRFVRDDATGRVIGYIKGRTDAEVDARVKAIVSETNETNLARGDATVSEIDLTAISDHADAVDNMFISTLRDMSGYKQTGQTKGRNLEQQIDVSGDEIEAMLVAARMGYDDLKNRYLASVYSDAVGEASALRQRFGGGREAAKRTFFDPASAWENALLNRTNRPPESFMGRAHTFMEDAVNALTGKIGGHMQRPLEVLDQLVNKEVRPGTKPATAAELARAQKLMDAYTPWDGLANKPELMDAIKLRPSQDPFSAKRALHMANKVTGELFLKFSNLAHPILNMTGIVATMPSVTAGVMRRPNETEAAWRSRVGHIAEFLGEGTASVSPAKVLAEGLHIAMNDKAFYDYAMKRNYLQQNLIEELEAAIDTRPSNFVEAVSKFTRTADVLNTWMINPVQRRLTGRAPSLPTLSERSETFSRAWAHAGGYHLAKTMNPGATEEQLHSFAHWFANQNIADYTPGNRGEAFQGLAGIPFGLFQSYGVNILQRLFRYVEDGNKRALTYAAFMQGAMFGTESLPGWPLLNEMYFKVPDMQADERGATSLNERIYAAFGKGYSDLLMTGTPSNLAALLGDGGINLYASGDINPRLPLVPPAASALAGIAQSIGRSVAVAAEELPASFDGNRDAHYERVASVLGNYFPSRGVRGMMDLIAGEKIDRNGNLVRDTTRDTLGIVSRLLGTRTTNELRLGEALGQNAQAAAQRQQDMDAVREQLMAALRSGDKKVSQEELAYALNRYLLAGGRLDQWDRWLKYTAAKADNPRVQREIDRLTIDGLEIAPANVASVMRMQNAGGDLESPIQKRRVDEMVRP